MNSMEGWCISITNVAPQNGLNRAVSAPGSMTEIAGNDMLQARNTATRTDLDREMAKMRDSIGELFDSGSFEFSSIGNP